MKTNFKDGRVSLCISTKNKHSQWLFSEWFNVNEGVKTNLHIWMQSAQKKVPVKILIQQGISHKQLDVGTVRSGGGLSKTFKVGKIWQNFRLNGTMPDAYKHAFRIALKIPADCTVWIDGLKSNIENESLLKHRALIWQCI